MPVTPQGHTYRQVAAYDVAPGQTVTVSAGGVGRPLAGKLVLPTSVKSVDMRQATHVYAQVKQDRAKSWVSYLPFVGGSGGVVTAHVTFVIEPDGKVRAEDVPPGEYVLIAVVRDPAPVRRPQDQVLARVEHTFVVPGVPKCPTDEVLDLGSIQLRSP
jgi:hypothetical protein